MCKNRLCLVGNSGDNCDQNIKGLGKEDYEFEASPGYKVRPYLNIQTNNKSFEHNVSLTMYACIQYLSLCVYGMYVVCRSMSIVMCMIF